MRVIRSITLFLIIIIMLNAPCFNETDKAKAFPESPLSNAENGSFFLNNTSETNLLLESSIYALNLIGKKWNLTISVQSNSSTGINISVTRSGGNPTPYITGTENFQVMVNETRSELYTSILVCDYIQTTNFHYSLSNSTRYSTGTYSIVVIENGLVATPGTGCVGSPDPPITSRSPTSSTTIYPNFLLILATITVIVLKAKKKSE